MLLCLTPIPTPPPPSKKKKKKKKKKVDDPSDPSLIYSTVKGGGERGEVFG